MDNPNTNNIDERGPQVYVEPVTAREAVEYATKVLDRILAKLEADDEIMNVLKRMKDC